MTRFSGRLLAVAALACLAAPAPAAIVVGTFQGTIIFGTDDSGYFTGTEGAFLEGPITGTFRYDTLLAQPAGLPGEYDDGGPADIEWLDFEVTINSTTYAFGSFAATTVEQTGQVTDNGVDGDSLILSSQRRGVGDNDEEIRLDLSYPDADFLTGTDLPQAFTFTSALGGGGNQLILRNSTAISTVLFTVETASAELAPVPEPATWMMMISGFGLVGAGLRHRRRAQLQAA